ncbi:hypothetical protein ACET3Z_005559 [Daucus carota]
MEFLDSYDLRFGVITVLVGMVVATFGLMRWGNEWYYERKLGGIRQFLPPGDMGWPLIGNMLSFAVSFKKGHPDSFIETLHTRFNRTHIYKSHMFGSPSVIVTSPEACRKVLMDNETFGPGWPKAVTILLGDKGFHGITNEEHRRLRRLTAGSLSGQEALSFYIEYIKDIAVTSLKDLSEKEKPIELLTEMRKNAFNIIMYIILGIETSPELEKLEKEYHLLTHALKAMRINLPGFAYHRGLQARKKLIKKFGTLVEQRRVSLENKQTKGKRFMVDLLMETEEDGKKLSNQEIVDLIIIYLLAGHESFAHASTWVLINLLEHPQYYQLAKDEQEKIVKKRVSVEDALNLAEIKQMEYLSKVIDETLRVANLSFTLFREAKTDVHMNGYTIPKGWKVLPWIRSVHMDSQNYKNPNVFNPSRSEDNTSKGAGMFMPFGAGSRLCPGMNLAKLEICIFLHYFLLHYKLERLTLNGTVAYIPITRPSDNCIARIQKLSSI